MMPQESSTVNTHLGLPLGLSWPMLAVRSLRGFRDLALDARCAQFAYYSLFAVVHLLIVLIATLTRLPLSGVMDSLVEAIGRTLPPEAAGVIELQITDIQQRHATSLSVWALLVFAYTGTRIFMTISRGLNNAYGISEERRGWQVHALGLVATAASFLVFLFALVLMVVGPELSRWLTGQPKASFWGFFLYRGVRWTVVCLMVLVNSLLIYRLAPSVRQGWSALWVGGAFATAGWVVISLALRYYVVNVADYNEVYGALGGVVVLMLWLYMTGLVILMGGKINGEIYRAAQAAARKQDKK